MYSYLRSSAEVSRMPLIPTIIKNNNQQHKLKQDSVNNMSHKQINNRHDKQAGIPTHINKLITRQAVSIAAAAEQKLCNESQTSALDRNHGYILKAFK